MDVHAAAAPLLVISSEFDDDEVVLTIASPEGIPTVGRMRTTAFVSRRQWLYDALHEGLIEVFADRYGATQLAPVEPGMLDTPLRELRKSARTFMGKLFPGRVNEVVAAFTLANRAWKIANQTPPIIEVRGPAGALPPVELWPAYDVLDRSIRTADELHSGLRCFAGFSAIVHRTITRGHTSIPCADTLRGRPRIPLRLFRHETLPGTAREAEFLAHHTEVQPPWHPPTAAAEADFVEAFAASLFAPGPAQIQHFSCHCETLDERAGGGAITLTPCNKGPLTGHGIGAPLPEFTATLDQLDDQFVLFECRPGSSPRPKPLPFTFLNACESSRIQSIAASSFPEFFLRAKGNRGFLGSETPVPDSVAAAFAQCFYVHLLDGVPVGQAVYRARWDLVEQYHEPLGALYTLYANPALRMSVSAIGRPRG